MELIRKLGKSEVKYWKIPCENLDKIQVHSRLSNFHETSISISAKACPILLKIKTKEVLLFAEAFIRSCSAKKSFRPVTLLKRDSNKHCNYIIKENLAQVLSCEFCKVFENTFIHRTPSVTGSVFTKVFPSLIKSLVLT